MLYFATSLTAASGTLACWLVIRYCAIQGESPRTLGLWISRVLRRPSQQMIVVVWMIGVIALLIMVAHHRKKALGLSSSGSGPPWRLWAALGVVAALVSGFATPCLLVAWGLLFLVPSRGAF